MHPIFKSKDFSPVIQMRFSRILLNQNENTAFLRKVIGAVKENPLPQPTKATLEHSATCFAIYRTYNPSLTAHDFQSLISVDSEESSATKSSLEVFKRKDPRFFTFSDRYVLRFVSSQKLKSYLRLTRLNRLDERSVKFLAADVNAVKGDMLEYTRNLKNACTSEDKYFAELKENVDISEDIDWDELGDLETRSVVVWNLPPSWDKLMLRKKFWWYDIAHSFRLFWDHDRKIYLTFIHFNSKDDAASFRDNLHGSVFEESKVLIEPL